MKEAHPMAADDLDAKQRYPAFFNLVRTYFDQDYHLISEDADKVVAAFKEDNSPEFVAQAVQDIQSFLASHPQEDPELANIFRKVFKPEVNFYEWEGRTTREALLRVIQVLA